MPVRLVNILTNLIQTVAGTGNAGLLGDGDLAPRPPQLNDPFGVAVSSAMAPSLSQISGTSASACSILAAPSPPPRCRRSN